MTFDIRHLLVYLCAALLAVAPGLAWGEGADECRKLVEAGNFEDAYPICKAAAEQGDAEAQFNLGLMYYAGWGVIKDPQESYVWFLLAANSGNENAQTIINFIKNKEHLGPNQISTATDKAKRLESVLGPWHSVEKMIAAITIASIILLAWGFYLLFCIKNKIFNNIESATRTVGVTSIIVFLSVGFGMLLLFTGIQSLALMAAVVGPFLAVLASTWLHDKWTKKERRKKLFNTLITLRAQAYLFSTDRIRELNVVTLEFNEENVVEAWENYISHMKGDIAPDPSVEDIKIWGIDATIYYDTLLVEMAKALGHKEIDHEWLKDFSYSPAKLLLSQELEEQLKVKLHKVLDGKKPISIIKKEPD